MKIRKYICLLAITALISLCFSSVASGATITAQGVLDKAAQKLNSSKSLSANFTLSTGGHRISGTIKKAGTKFAIESKGASSWYNGKDMWTYSAATGETTLVTPSASELADVNPLMYVTGYKNSFVPSFSKEKIKGGYVIDLVARKRGSAVRKVTLYFNANFVPTRIKADLGSSGISDITVSNVNYSAGISSSAFNYPKSRYPKARIVDLR